MELYVHIPFCKRKCRYCDFASWAGEENLIPAYVDAVLKEAAQAKHALGNACAAIETFYLGGGTPSLLPSEELRRLLIGLQELFPFLTDGERTSECNPGTLTGSWLETALKMGINRLSMGMQAAQTHLLRALGRIHTLDKVMESVDLVRASGITNLNLDLMFGLPGQTLADWRETLEAALALSPEHLSCYGLIPEEGTPLFSAMREGELSLPADEEEREMYDAALMRLAQAGFEQYEISNFSLPGYACRHNMGYWRQVPYLGLGVAAASMFPGESQEVFCVRRSNACDLKAYLRQAEEGAFVPSEETAVSPAEARFETMMLGLRTTAGVGEEEFHAMHGVQLQTCYGEKLRSFAQRGLMQKEGDRWRLTRRGMDVQNTILVELMGM